MERKSEHRECWGVPKRLVDENYKRKRVTNLTGLSLERAGDIFTNMKEQWYRCYIGKQRGQTLPSDWESKLAKARGGWGNLSERDWQHRTVAVYGWNTAEELGKQGEVESWIGSKPIGWADDRGKDLMFYASILPNSNRKQSKVESGCVFVEVFHRLKIGSASLKCQTSSYGSIVWGTFRGVWA